MQHFLIGLSGDAAVANIGSLDYLLPCADSSKVYDLMDIARYGCIQQGMMIGGGIGPFQCVGKPCEVSTELVFSTRGCSCNRSLLGFFPKDAEAPCSERAPNTLMATNGQVFITEAKPGKVIEIIASSRVGCESIIDLIHNSLYDKFKKYPTPFAMGGTFYLQNSGAQVHLLSDIPKEPYHTFPCLKDYQTLFELDRPIIGVGSILSHDPDKLGFRMSSFHCWKADRLLTGHFENDTCPEQATYTMYLSPATKVYRLDKPVYYR